MHEITVVGGGLAGLIAASEAAESGAAVRLLEAHQRLGGRAGSTSGDHIANLGPHALYTPTALWSWLRARGLHRPSVMPKSPAIATRWQGTLRRVPPRGAVRAARLCRRDAPVDVSLREWATSAAGDSVAQMLAGVAGPLTFDHDPGRLSAAFVVSRIRSILLRPVPAARYLVGGWGALVSRLAAHAQSVGVRIETGVRVESITDLGPGPVIVALPPGAASSLVGDPSLRWESPRVALVDVAFRRRRRDPYLVFDLDEAVFVTRVTAVVPSLAPRGESLVQASVGLRPGETPATGQSRIDAVLDLAYPHWPSRRTWGRRGSVVASTGALDLPGFTWRDRPPVAYADGVWLAGDWLAAPGHLAEVSCASAIQAAHAAMAARQTTAARPRSGAGGRSPS